MFKASIRISYAISYNDYNVIRLIYEVQDADYCALQCPWPIGSPCTSPYLVCVMKYYLSLISCNHAIMQSCEAFCHYIHLHMYLRGQGTLTPQSNSYTI